MLLARRLYLYFISAISLVTLAIGLTNLIDLLFHWTWERINGVSLLSPDPDDIRRQLSIHVALVIVSLPIWLLHWWLIERSIARGEMADIERRSSLRDLYLTVGLTIPFIFWVINAVRLVQAAVRRLLDVAEQTWSRTDFETTLAILLVTGAIWAYHAWIRIRDERVAPLDESSDWLPRLYLFGAAFTGAMLLLFGLSGLFALLVEALAGDHTTMTNGNWWGQTVVNSLGLIIVGLGVWLIHWGYALRLLTGDDWRARRLERSRLPYVYVYLLMLVGVFASLLLVGQSLQTVLNEVLGGSPPAEPFWQRLLEPLARAVPFLAIWIYHRSYIVSDSGREGISPVRVTLQRIYTYGISLAGLGVGAFGIAATLYLVFDVILDPGIDVIDISEARREDLSGFIALAIVGTTIWLWHWYHVQRWTERDPRAERATTPRRFYLLAAIAASVVALLGNLAVVIYEFLAAMLGVADVGLRDELSAPVAIAIVAGAILAYHGTVLRADIAARPEPAQERAAYTFTVVGPAGTSENEFAEIVRASLPTDFELRSR
jgi:hypothetical protein